MGVSGGIPGAAVSEWWDEGLEERPKKKVKEKVAKAAKSAFPRKKKPVLDRKKTSSGAARPRLARASIKGFIDGAFGSEDERGYPLRGRRRKAIAETGRLSERAGGRAGRIGRRSASREGRARASGPRGGRNMRERPKRRENGKKPSKRREKRRSARGRSCGRAGPSVTARNVPRWVVVPAGSFMMGSPSDEVSPGMTMKVPRHRVTIARPFAVGKYEVTFAEWDAVRGGRRLRRPPAGMIEGWGRGRRPVINVNWKDAKAYVRWLNRIRRASSTGC